MESDDALAQQQRKNDRAQSGRTFKAEGLMGYSPEVEAQLEALPGYTALRMPLQNPATGQFYFMLGINSLDSSAVLR